MKMKAGEIFRETIKRNGRPERILKQYEGLEFVFGDPISAKLNGGMKRGTTFINRWGVTIDYPETAPGPMPHITEETKVLKDITRWRDYVKVPDISGCADMDWSAALKRADEIRRRGNLVCVLMGTGLFEQCHYLMGFEDTLSNLYEHPDEMKELIDCIYDFRMEYLMMLIDKLHPDAVLSHDDWGTKDALFMKADMWREFFKEKYRGFYGYMRSKDVITIHHADSYCAPIVDDMHEIGIQVWQGALPENDIPALLRQTDGKLVYMGGIGAAIDRADATEEEVRTYVRNVLDECAAYGHFIPCITYGLPGAVYRNIDPWIDRTIDEYNSVLHAPNFRRPSARRTARTTVRESKAEEITEQESADVSVLADIRKALKQGQRRKVLKLTNEALSAGRKAQDILNGGLIRGMTELGDDFSKNRAFVPEMLMAAKCMTAATEVLKPHLVSAGVEPIGKVCLGTVKGDMHDIGKNLVKIMMEGSGITVVDLGADVEPERFIQAAIDEKCDIIACSALLTTTMGEMRKVVELAKEAGIRDKVKIMIGGAPISQAYCDEIGADIYTDDAAQAARAAARAIRSAGI